jgi:hypothetical protein
MQAHQGFSAVTVDPLRAHILQRPCSIASCQSSVLAENGLRIGLPIALTARMAVAEGREGKV